MVHVFTDNGREWFVCFGGSGSEPGRFLRPNAVAWISDEQIAVLDAGNSRVQILTMEVRVVKPYISMQLFWN
jgi:hypothetical protein